MRAPLILIALAACQPMYGAKPQVMKAPPRGTVPVATIEPEKPVEYIDTCATNFHDGTKPHRAPAAAKPRVDAGVAKVDAAQKETEPKKVADLATDGIRQFTAALQQDPFDADATLGLARAYDEVYRKRCALKLLGRLAQLAQHPKLGVRARDVVKQVEDNDTWFKGYRSQAKDAVLGASTP